MAERNRENQINRVCRQGLHPSFHARHFEGAILQQEESNGNHNFGASSWLTLERQFPGNGLHPVRESPRGKVARSLTHPVRGI